MILRVQIKSFVEGLFQYNNNLDRFKLNLRDFLIQLKEFAGDNAEMFAEEKEQQDAAAKAAERERLSKVGGLLKPADLNEDDDELWLDEELRTELTANTAEDENSETVKLYRPMIPNDFNGWDMYGL